MGWNFRRTLNLGGGFRINLSKGGIGASGGLKEFRVGLGPRGKRLQITIPGTGIYYRKDEGWGTPNSRFSLFQSLGRLVQVAVLGVSAAGLIAWIIGLLS
jgi:Protein of unknown function (DUF4236)